MPTLILKLIALSGVISAGCFAVWKANTELQPIEAPDPTQFSSLEGETADGVGLGGQQISPAARSKSTSVEQQPKIDQILALADHAFSENETAEETSTPRGMPAAFPPEQEEPAVDEPQAETAAEQEELEPGVASLEALDAAEKEKPEPLIKTLSAAAPRSPAVEANPLRRFSAEAGTPALMTIPKSAAKTKDAVKTATRSQSPSLVVPANAESYDDSEFNVVPATDTEEASAADLSAPDDVSEIVPAAVEPSGNMPNLRPQGARTRPSPVRSPAATAAPEEDLNPFDLSGSVPDSMPEGVSEPELIDTSHAVSPSQNHTRSSLPTPIESTNSSIPGTEPAQLNLGSNHRAVRAPTNTHAVGEDSAALPRTPTEEMLIGDATVEDSQLTPTQQPQLRIEKRAQAEAEVGEKFIYEIIVQNMGQVAAQHVIVEECIPKGCKMERSSPVAHLGRDRVLRWDLETMAPNTQKVIKVEVTPQQPGLVGRVATVRFSAMVATKTIVTAPILSLSIQYPKEVAVGESVPVKFVVTNTGTGTARKATLRTLLQTGLMHPAGLDLDKDLGTLAPGEKAEVDLTLIAEEKGPYAPSVIITANGIEQENRTLDLNVIESRLTLSREGHARRFVNRPAEFVTKVTNHSIKTMNDVMITEQLPEGVKPVGELGNALWNPTHGTVTWKVSELRPQEYSDLKLTVVSTRAGQLVGKIQAMDASGHRAELGTELDIQGFSSLTLDFQGDGKAVAVGEQVSMRVTVGNRGSAPAKSVQAMFEVPRQMTFVDAKAVNSTGPVKFTKEGNFVTFAELDELGPNATQTYDIVLVAAEEGTPSVRVDLSSAERPEPVRQEEAVTITPK